jgi:hypothetical protein
MQVEKVRVDASKKGRIICPKCQKEKSINAVSFRMNQDIKVTCECKHVYYIRFDQRRHSRKKVKLTGRFHKIDEEPTKLIHIEICDLSVSGLSFRRKNIENLREGDVLALTFILDNHEQSEIKTKASIRYVKETRVGIRFDESEESNQDLLRNYFSASTTRGTNANL